MTHAPDNAKKTYAICRDHESSVCDLGKEIMPQNAIRTQINIIYCIVGV